MRGPTCSYCGCNELNSLVLAKDSQLYFCNGKGDTHESHIIHHLRRVGSFEIFLPSENKFSNINLQCFLCKSRNIFKLGFLTSNLDGETYILCRSPCLYNELFPKGQFLALVSNNQIAPQFVSIPIKYSKIPISKTLSVDYQILKNHGRSIPKPDSNLPRFGLVYDNIRSYCSDLLAFIAEEKSESDLLFKIRKYTHLIFQWKSPTSFTFRCPPEMFKLITPGTLINISNSSTEETGFVKTRSSNLDIEVHFQSSSSFYKVKQNLSLQPSFNDTSFKRQSIAVKEFEYCNSFFKDIFLGKSIKHNKLHTTFPLESPRQLNQSQMKACSFALSHKFSLIQGPPGSGKTTTISALVLSFVKAGLSPVLVCAQSNVAVDFATKMLADSGMKVVRVLALFRETPSAQIEKLTSKKLAEAKFGDQFIRALSENSGKGAIQLERKIIQDAEVVCATCSGCGCSRMKSITFKAVVFDESGQCLDPDLILGVSGGAEYVVLVGDHKQLSPTLLSQKNMKNGYNQTLMQRLVLNGVIPQMLTLQYRMHPSISRFVSDEFYGGYLKDGITKEDRIWKTEIWPNKEHPLLFWNVSSQEEICELGVSYLNQEEGKKIAILIDELDVSAQDIGIITPYSGQQTFLAESLSFLCTKKDSSYIENLEIASVDSFQGREKNFIIFSLVRANEEYEIGFLKDARRLCVSLSRAKFGLIVVGNAKTFAKNSFWCDLVSYCQDLHCFVEGDIGNFAESQFNPLATSGHPETRSEPKDSDDGDDEIFAF